MFFSVARLRPALVSLFLSSLVAAHENVLRTSSVSYCSPPESIIVSQLDIAYYPGNNSVVFNVSAASVSPNNKVKVDLKVNVYGSQPFEMTVNTCTLLDGALCPLPRYTFNGADVIVLPESVLATITKNIPRIAYIMPDIEAFAQLTLTDVETGEVKACLQTTLSNSWTTHQRAAEWTTAGIALLATVLAALQTILSADISMMAVRLLDIMSLYQTIALSGLLALNFPSLYRAFTLNFAWSLGLFTASTNSTLQGSINSLRHRTGGHLPDPNSDGATPLVNRRLSPYNQIGPSAAFMEAFSTSTNATGFAPKILVGGDVATVTNHSSNVLQAGIPIYTNSLRISVANAFMTVFIILLILYAILLLLLGVTYVFARLSPKGGDLRIRFSSFARAWILRIALVSSLPVTVFAFYQWTLKDSWLSVLLSVLLLVAVMGAVLLCSWVAIRQPKPSDEGTRAEAPLTDPYRLERMYFFIPVLSIMVIKAIVTAFAQSRGIAQIVVFVALEFLLLLSLAILRPYPHESGRSQKARCCCSCWTCLCGILSSPNALPIYLCITRLVCHGLMISFVETIAVKPIPRAAIGAITAVLFSVAVIILFFQLCIGVVRLAWNEVPYGRKRQEPTLTSTPSVRSDDMEKAHYFNNDASTATATSTTMTESMHHGQYERPLHPSPPTTPSISSLGNTLPRTGSVAHSPLPSTGSPVHPSPTWTQTSSPWTPPSTGPRASIPSSYSEHSRQVSSSAPSPLTPAPVAEGQAHVL